MSSRYELQRFVELFDEWVDLESPSDDLRLLVLHWIFTRAEDPYAGARREPGFDNLWHATVPGSSIDGDVVLCVFWIEEQAGAVRCDRIATLSWPV